MTRLPIDRLLASIVENSDDAIISKSLDSIIRSWNAAAERVFGFTAAEAVGQHISLIIPPERLSEEDHIIATLKAGRRVDHFETQRLRKDGARILVSLTVSPVKDEEGRVVGAAKIVRDVTRQRQAEERERLLLEATAAANAKFQALFEQGALFATIMDMDGCLVEANRPCWEGCGYSKEQLIGKPLWEGPWWAGSPPTARRLQEAVTRAARGAHFHGEAPYVLADGTERFSDLTILPITDESGKALFLAATWTDITDRKRLASDLREADRRKNEFLAMLAHELRNPLAPISNAVHSLRGARTDAARPAPEAALKILDRQVGQLARLVDDLLDVSRITRGKIALRKQQVDLRPVVDQAVEAMRALYGNRHQELTVSLPQEPIFLDADPARVAQVIGNLLNNACKFTDHGGHVWLTVTRDDDQAVIRVRDDGIGVAADQLPRLFDMFTQVDSSLERTREGLGIGLTLVKTLAEMHGGTVEARSEGLGRGSEFEVRLPALPSAAVPAPAPASPAQKLPATKRRVLIVDDNDDGADSLAMLLEEEGHEPHIAHDGLEALAAVERIRPDAVLLDIGLPKLNGYEVCRRVREQPWGKDLLIVALTGWGQEEDRHRSQQAGFDAHLVKPVDDERLLKLLKL